MDLRTAQEVEQYRKRKVRHYQYGMVYQCLPCLHQERKAVIDVKRRIKAHINKYHLRLDAVGFVFPCWDRKTPGDRITSYQKHVRVASDQNVDVNDVRYLGFNQSHYVLKVVDYIIRRSL
jgi:hypothetical protein